ncbi:response regulator [Variovorax sp.]|uniref:response regulator n=1 Tax=Variovorax sp. TaxID=1871043 RepID=UPI000C436CC4|nr:response regulator [Variovorax sp.]MBS82220.1 DNA-binding response regulator [Variovorax sp.]
MDHLLIVDDDIAIRGLLSRYLQEHGYRVTAAANGREMRRALASDRMDLIVLDLMLPDEDGLTLFRDLNPKTQVPVIMLTARDEAADRILGLELGADDYVPKPFEPRELLARIRSVMRRARRLPPNLVPEAVRFYRFVGWQLEVASRELVSPANVVISLGATEFRLLKVFLDHPRQIVSREQLSALASGKDISPLDRGVDVLVSRLRQHLDDDARQPSLIKTIRYEGYVMDANVEVHD